MAPNDAVQQVQHPELRESEERNKHVILVHGWAGGVASWGAFPDLLHDVPNSKVTVSQFTYKSGVLFPTSIADVAARLGTELQAARGEDETFLMCHASGATICQEAVLQLLRAGKSTDVRIKKVLLFAPPTSATDLKALASPSILAPLLKKHAADLSYLANLQKEWFARVTDGGDPNVPVDFRKDIDVVAIMGSQDEIVKAGVSKSLFNKVNFIYGDHLSITRPSSSNDEVFRFVVQEITKPPEK